jgi:hypothetical protein
VDSDHLSALGPLRRKSAVPSIAWARPGLERRLDFRGSFGLRRRLRFLFAARLP